MDEDEISRLVDFSNLGGEDPVGFGVGLEGWVVDGELGGVWRGRDEAEHEKNKVNVRRLVDMIVGN